MQVSIMKSLCLISALFLVLANVGPVLSQTISPPQQQVALTGSPFAVTTSSDGQYVFASLSGAANGIAIIKQNRGSASLLRVLQTGGGAFGLTVTRDGRYLLDTVQPIGNAATPQGVQFIDLQKAIAGQADAILGTVPTGNGSGPIEVALSVDNRFVFVSDEENETVDVIDFAKAVASGENASSIVGSIPVEQLPVGLAFSGDGRYLYITNEEANSTDPGYNPAACNLPNGTGGTSPGPEGTLTVVDCRKPRSTQPSPSWRTFMPGARLCASCCPKTAKSPGLPHALRILCWPLAPGPFSKDHPLVGGARPGISCRHSYRLRQLEPRRLAFSFSTMTVL
jgi:hypothetical protein